jgi:hypothetical protein
MTTEEAAAVAVAVAAVAVVASSIRPSASTKQVPPNLPDNVDIDQNPINESRSRGLNSP